jgi:hypothetical protein
VIILPATGAGLVDRLLLVAFLGACAGFGGLLAGAWARHRMPRGALPAQRTDRR